MQRPLTIYVAGPYTAPDLHGELANVERAVQIGMELTRKGHYPFVPHFSHYLDHAHKDRYGERLPWQFWMDMDDAFMNCCDAFFYISSSRGADIELERATKLGLQIFFSLDEVPAVEPEEPADLDDCLDCGWPINHCSCHEEVMSA